MTSQCPTITCHNSFQVSESAVFQEVTLEKSADETWKQWLKEETQGSKYIQTGEE
jgi:predicted transcriptional regulator